MIGERAGRRQVPTTWKMSVRKQAGETDTLIRIRFKTCAGTSCTNIVSQWKEGPPYSRMRHGALRMTRQNANTVLHGSQAVRLKWGSVQRPLGVGPSEEWSTDGIESGGSGKECREGWAIMVSVRRHQSVMGMLSCLVGSLLSVSIHSVSSLSPVHALLRRRSWVRVPAGSPY